MNSIQRKYILEKVDKKSIKEIAVELGLKERKIQKFLQKHRQNKVQTWPEKQIKPPKKWVILTSVIVIIILGFAVYANSLQGEFLWDDEYIVAVNPFIRSLTFLPQAFSNSLFRAYGVGKGSFYRPLQTLTYMVDYKFWGLIPAGYHLTNIILHIFCALLFYSIIILLVGDATAALIAAILFVIHPINTQAVTYISGRADPLSIFFALMSFICFISFLNSAGKIYRKFFYAVSFVSFILALLSKEAAMTFPLFFLYYIFVFKPGVKKGWFNQPALTTIPFFLAALIYAFFRLTLFNLSEGTFLARTPLYLRILTTCKNIFAYLGLLLAPVGLHMERQVAFVRSFFEPKVTFSFVALFAIAWWMCRIYYCNAVMFFFAGWFLLGLLPVSNILPLNATLAEHWVYLPSMGIYAIIGLGCSRLLDFSKKASFGPLLKFATIFALSVAIIIYGWLTIKRNKDWHDPFTLYLNTKKYAPDNYKVRNNLGRVYLEKNMLDEAVKEFEESVRLEPQYAQAHSNLGLAYEYKGRDKEAISEYSLALELIPGLAKTYINLAGVYLKTGKRDNALEIYQKGLIHCPSDSYLHSMFGLSLGESARLEEALAEGRKSLELSFEDPALHYNMAIIYEHNQAGIRYGVGFNLEQAKTEYLKAIRLDEKYHNAYYNLAILYEFNSDGKRYGEGFDFKAAEKYYLIALQLNPQGKEAKINLEYLHKILSSVK